MYVGGPIQFTIFFILQNQLPRHMRQLSVLVTSKFSWWFDCSFVLLCFFGVSCCHWLFHTTFRHSFMVTVSMRLCKQGEFSVFWDFYSSYFITSYLCLILWFYLLGSPQLKSNWLDSRTAFTVPRPVSEWHVPQVSDSAKDQEGGGGHAGMLSSFSRTGREKTISKKKYSCLLYM